MTQPIYIASAGKHMIAGPIVVAAVYFISNKEAPDLAVYSFTKSYTQGALISKLDRLEEDVDYVCNLIVLQPGYIDTVSSNVAISKAVPLAGYGLEFEHDLNANGFCLANHYTYGNLVDNFVEGEQWRKAYADMVAKYHQRWWMLHHHGAYPQYGWDKNYGVANKGHYKAMLTHGPVYDLHRTNAYLYMGHTYLKLVQDKDPWLKENNYISTPPLWWKAKMGKTGFFDALHDKEIKEIYNYFTKLECVDEEPLLSPPPLPAQPAPTPTPPPKAKRRPKQKPKAKRTKVYYLRENKSR